MGVVLCILDGFTDSEFDPADYPALSGLRRLGDVDTALGEKPESLNCILHLLGIRNVPPLLRGYAEALGDDIPVGENDLILRGSWFSRDETGRCVAPMAAPAEIPAGLPCRYVSLGGYKSLLIFPGLGAAARDLATYPPYALAGRLAEDLCPRGCPEVEAVFRALCSPRCCCIPWGQSRPAALPPFPERGCVISGTSVVRGIGKLLGMDVRTVPGATGDTDTDLNAKRFAALDAAGKYPFVLLHINGADEASHRKDAMEKRAFLSRVDAEIVCPLATNLPFFIVTGDHAADPRTGIHAGTTQPVFVNGFPGKFPDFLPFFPR